MEPSAAPSSRGASSVFAANADLFVKLVIFDVDGTLVDSQQLIVAAQRDAFARHGLAAPSRARSLSVVGLSLPEAFTALVGAKGPVESLAAAYKDAFARLRADPAMTGGTARTRAPAAARPAPPPAVSRQARPRRSYRSCLRQSKELRGLRGAQRRAFITRCQLGLRRPR